MNTLPFTPQMTGNDFVFNIPFHCFKPLKSGQNLFDFECVATIAKLVWAQISVNRNASLLMIRLISWSLVVLLSDVTTAKLCPKL